MSVSDSLHANRDISRGVMKGSADVLASVTITSWNFVKVRNLEAQIVFALLSQTYQFTK